MARKTSIDYEKTQQRLLEVGLDFFEKKGYNATGVQEIASGATIPKGSFYTYFSSKEDFGVHVIRYYTETSLTAFKKLLIDATQKEDTFFALRAAFFTITEKYDAAVNKKGCLLGTLAAEISEASEECKKELHFSVNRYIDILAEYIKAGQEVGSVRTDADSRQLACLLWDCWQGSLLRMKVETSICPVNDNLDLFFRSILSPSLP